jgi:putative glycosyltransferase (TIGR04348 family)
MARVSNSMKIALVMPAGADKRSGNRYTAQRWAGFLRSLGHRVSVTEEWAGEDAAVLIALHARKSHTSIERFHRLRPGAPLVVVLTGTDLYRDLAVSDEAQLSLSWASRLIVLQDRGRRELAQRHRAKTHVVFQSADVTLRHAPQGKRFRIAVVGHLREEKDPFRAVSAIACLPSDTNLEVIQLGAALTPKMGKQAELWMQREPRYRWLGSKAHQQAMRWMASSHLLVVSSVMEGGANVICEAARIGVPVLASRVSGNIGMLGSDYPGYFRLFDDAGLARLIARAATDKAYYRKLRRSVLARRPLFAPAAERRALQRALQHPQ